MTMRRKMARFNAGPSALTAAAAAAAAAFALCSSIGGVYAYAAKGLGGIASSAATHPSSSALVPSSALARSSGRYPGDYDDLPYGPPYLNDMDDYGPGPYGYGRSPMSSTYKPLFNNQRGSDGRGGPMALAPPRFTGRLSDRGKMNSYNRPYDYNYDGYFPDVYYDPRSYERREEKRSSTFKPLFASSRDQHPQNMRRDALAPMPRGRRSIRLSDEGKDQERFDRRMMRESDRRDYRGGPYSNDLPYGAPSGGGRGSTGRLSDVGKEYDRRGGSMLARRPGPPPPPMYYDERPGMRRQSDLGKEKRYSGGVTYNADANEYSRSSTFKPLFDSQRNKMYMADSEFVMRGTPDRRRLSDGRDGGRYRISDDGRFGSGGNSDYYDPSRSAYFKYGGGLR